MIYTWSGILHLTLVLKVTMTGLKIHNFSCLLFVQENYFFVFHEGEGVFYNELVTRYVSISMWIIYDCNTFSYIL